jgi:hypothetical protein
MAVAEPREPLHQVVSVSADAEGEAEPRARVDARRLADHPLGLADVLVEAIAAEERHAGVIEGVVSDQVPIGDDSPREIGKGLDPSALEEDRGSQRQAEKLVEHPRGVLAVVRTIRVLRVEGQRNARTRGHFSTPVITIPRMKKRWQAKNSSIGTTIVMRVAAWTSSTRSL